MKTTANSTRALKTYGAVKSPAIDPSSQAAFTYGVTGISIDPAEFDIAKGLFETNRDMSPAAIESFATLLVESAKQQGLNIFEVIQVDPVTGKLGFDDQGISLINALRPSGSKIGFRKPNSDSINPHVARNIIP